MNIIEVLISKIIVNVFFFISDYFKCTIFSVCSTLTPEYGCWFFNRIKRLGLLDFIEYRCIYEIVAVLFFAFCIAKSNQFILKYIPPKYLNENSIYIHYKWLLLFYLPMVLVLLLLNVDLINIVLFMMFFNYIICLFLIDIKIGYLPDILNYPLLWTGLLYQTYSSEGNVTSAIYAVIISYLFIIVITTLMEQIRQRPQMGRGDFKLIAACSAWLGMMKLPLFLAVAASLGGIHYGIANLVSRKKTIIDIPFGPAIIVSTVYWLFAPLIYKYILSIDDVKI